MNLSQDFEIWRLLFPFLRGTINSSIVVHFWDVIGILACVQILKSDCFLVLQESDVIGCYNNTFSLLSNKC